MAGTNGISALQWPLSGMKDQGWRKLGNHRFQNSKENKEVLRGFNEEGRWLYKIVVQGNEEA